MSATGKDLSKTGQKIVSNEEKSPECSKIFILSPLVNLYSALDSLPKRPTYFSYIPAMMKTPLSYVGVTTSYDDVEKAMAIIEKKFGKEQIKKWIESSYEMIEKETKMNSSLHKMVYEALRELYKDVLKNLPAEMITFNIAGIEKGSGLRKCLEKTFTYYKDELKNNNFPTDFEDEMGSQLGHIMKYSR